MLNLLIFCNEIVTAKKLLNNIAGNLENTRVIGISDDLLEANTLIIKYQPELIITTNEMIFSLLKKNLFLIIQK